MDIIVVRVLVLGVRDSGFYRNMGAGFGIAFMDGTRDLRTFAPIATAHFFAHVTHTSSCIADHEGKHDAKSANIFHKNGA